MSKKKTRLQTKLGRVSPVKQVSGIDMVDKEINSLELTELIRTIIREDINGAFNKLQPQFDAVKKDVAECAYKVIGIEESLLYGDPSYGVEGCK